MKRLCLIGIVLCAAFAEQAPRQGPPQDVPVDIRPTREAIVKDDYKRNLQDAARLASLAEELKSELENGDKDVVSVKTMKKAEDIEKLARSIHSRLKRY